MKDVDRRTFLEAAVFPIAARGVQRAPQSSGRGIRLEHGVDRLDAPRTIAGANVVTYKVVTQDTQGGLFLLEQVSMRKGGPPRHLHHAQEEWFYVMEGEHIFEVGQDRMRLKPGDSLLAPRQVPHVWAYVGENPGKILIAFQPAGKMEPSFRKRPSFTTLLLTRSCTGTAAWT